VIGRHSGGGRRHRPSSSQCRFVFAARSRRSSRVPHATKSVLMTPDGKGYLTAGSAGSPISSWLRV
jgi:hypothetical protein